MDGLQWNIRHPIDIDISPYCCCWRDREETERRKSGLCYSAKKTEKNMNSNHLRGKLIEFVIHLFRHDFQSETCLWFSILASFNSVFQNLQRTHTPLLLSCLCHTSSAGKVIGHDTCTAFRRVNKVSHSYGEYLPTGVCFTLRHCSNYLCWVSTLTRALFFSFSTQLHPLAWGASLWALFFSY